MKEQSSSDLKVLDVISDPAIVEVSLSKTLNPKLLLLLRHQC